MSISRPNFEKENKLGVKCKGEVCRISVSFWSTVCLNRCWQMSDIDCHWGSKVLYMCAAIVSDPDHTAVHLRPDWYSDISSHSNTWYSFCISLSLPPTVICEESDGEVLHFCLCVYLSDVQLGKPALPHFSSNIGISENTNPKLNWSFALAIFYNLSTSSCLKARTDQIWTDYGL